MKQEWYRAIMLIFWRVLDLFGCGATWARFHNIGYLPVNSMQFIMSWIGIHKSSQHSIVSHVGKSSELVDFVMSSFLISLFTSPMLNRSNGWLSFNERDSRSFCGIASPPTVSRGHSRNQPKGGRNSPQRETSRCFLTIFLSLYSLTVQRPLQRTLSALFMCKTSVKPLR